MAEWRSDAAVDCAGPDPGLAALNPPSRPALPPLSFRAVNCRGSASYDGGLQRHHLLPRQLVQARCFGPLFEDVGRARVGFDDFRANGLLLPASEAAALRIGLPLHRGPHRDYNAMVIERVGEVEGQWSQLRLRAPEIAHEEAVRRLGQIQRDLRRRLLDPGRRLRLNRRDPLGHGVDFSLLDAMVESLWSATAPQPGNQAEAGLILGDQPANGAAAASRPAFAW